MLYCCNKTEKLMQNNHTNCQNDKYSKIKKPKSIAFHKHYKTFENELKTIGENVIITCNQMWISAFNLTENSK